MDREDRMFAKVVGEKALRTLRTRNVRLYQVFKKVCEENGEKPERVLGNILLRFAKSVVEGDTEFAEDVMSRTIKLSALAKREALVERVNELIDLKKKLSEGGSSRVDKLIENFIVKELESAMSSPLDVLKGRQQVPNKIVIDENVLAMMPPEQLDMLVNMAMKVKQEKMKAMQVTSEELEKVLEEEVSEVDEEEEEAEYTEADEEPSGDTEGSEESGEGS